jgi:DNA-binding FrmR family transcriptional regulator
MEADKNVDNKQTEEQIAADGQQCCCHRTKNRTQKEYRDLINRLSRIEGQIRGIKGMVEKNCYCPDIMIQVAAANAALNSFNKALLAEHIRSCVATDIREGRDETIEELVETLQKVMK